MFEPVLLLKIGVIWIAAVLFAEMARRLKLPVVVGYLVGGILLGPFVLRILDAPFLHEIKTLKGYLLAYILYLVGRKIKLANVLQNPGKFTLLALLQAGLTLILVALLSLWKFSHPLQALLLGIIAMPTAVISVTVVDEYHADGPLSQTLFFLIAFDNLLALLLFLPLTTYLKTHALALGPVAWALGGALLLALLLGLLTAYVETVLEEEALLFLYAWGIFALGFGLAALFHLDERVYALLFGLTAANASVTQQRALGHLDRISDFAYSLFFFVAGASLNFPMLVQLRFAVLLYIVGRVLGKVGGSILGTRRTGLPLRGDYLGLGILSQGGLSTGLALALGASSLGMDDLVNVALASTVVFELVGPVLLKEVLVRAGEIPLAVLIRRGVDPLFDVEFQNIVHEFMRRVGLEPARQPDITLTTVMRRSFPTIRADDPVTALTHAFRNASSDTLVVLDETDAFVGVVFLHDLERLPLLQMYQQNLRVRDLARWEFLLPTASLREALERLQELGTDALPVVEKGRVVGMVYRKDLLSALL